MPTTKPMPFLVAQTTDSGDPQLAGKRRLADDIEHATDVADEIGGQVFALEPIEPNPVAPLPARSHVRLVGGAEIPVLVVEEPMPTAEAFCPCGYHAWLGEGASDDEREAHYRDVEDHYAYCSAEVA